MYSDEIREQEELNKPIEVDVHPLSKWKRLLVFLADFAINFILSFIFLSVLVAPLASLITKADQRGDEIRNKEIERDMVLVNNGLLFQKNDSRDYNVNLSYTFDRYLSYFVLDEVVDSKNPEFTNDIKNEVIYTYFKNIKNDDDYYLELYTKQNQKYEYFIIDEGSVSLKNEYKEMLKYHYIPNEKLGKNGEEAYKNLSNIFTIFYKCVMDDILKNDLVFNNQSYLELSKELIKLQNHDKNIFTVCVIASFLLSSSILYFLIPLIKNSGKTLSMHIMKVERVGLNNLSKLKLLDNLLSQTYKIFFDFAFVMFIPMIFLASGMVYAISMPFIPYASLLGIILILTSMFFLIFNPMNRTLSDILSRSVLITSGDLDQVYYMKGYYK